MEALLDKKKSDHTNQAKAVSVNPIKTSPAMGASMVLHGIKGAMSLIHAAPGCTFLGKVLLTQHTKEPVGVVGTDIKEVVTILGSDEVLKNKIETVYKGTNPQLIGVIGTALSEIRGEDIDSVINPLRKECGDIVYISAADYIGGFDEGFGTALEALVEQFAVSAKKLEKQVNLLPSASMTVAEVEYVKEQVQSFGLDPIVLPDISLSLDGSKDRFSNLPADGTRLEDIEKMGDSIATLVFGSAGLKAGKYLKEKFKIPLFSLPIPIGVSASDIFIKLLMELSGKEPNSSIKRWRNRLIDAMVDSHLIMADKKFSIALEADINADINHFLEELGAERSISVAPTKSVTGDKNIKVGDLEDIELNSEDADILISNSHGTTVAERLDIPLIRMGFPIFDRYGDAFRLRVGYEGSLKLLFEIVNTLLDNEKEHKL